MSITAENLTYSITRVNVISLLSVAKRYRKGLRAQAGAGYFDLEVAQMDINSK